MSDDTNRPCAHCGASTEWACAECLDRGADVDVCEAPACRLAHLDVCNPTTLDAAIRDELMRRELTGATPEVTS